MPLFQKLLGTLSVAAATLGSIVPATADTRPLATAVDMTVWKRHVGPARPRLLGLGLVGDGRWAVGVGDLVGMEQVEVILARSGAGGRR